MLNRTLTLNFRANISSIYKNNSYTITGQVKDNISKSVPLLLTNGTGPNKADAQYHLDLRLINSTQSFDLNSYALKDVWGEGLNFHAIKFLYILNKETNLASKTKYLEYYFKRERGVIGPSGFRIIGEPAGAGIGVQSSSQSEEEGKLTLATNGDVTLELILIGATQEMSSSSGN